MEIQIGKRITINVKLNNINVKIAILFLITSKTILDNSKIKYSQLKCLIKGILDIKPIYKIALELRLPKTQFII